LIRILQAVSRNEGRLEAINSYDNAFMSFGMFQWTAGRRNEPGELAGLLVLVQRTNADVFDNYFGRYELGIKLKRDAKKREAKTGFLTLAGTALDKATHKAKLRAVEWAYRFWRAGQNAAERRHLNY
jgi:hypothetical protein